MVEERVLDRKRLATPADLKAVSNPQRLLVIDVLYSLRRVTVSQIAEVTGLAVGSVSYHLRTLAKVDIARPVSPPGHTDRRQRWWQPAHEDGFEWDDDIHLTDWGAAGMRARWAAIRSVDWASLRADPDDLPPSWAGTTIHNDGSMQLTPQEVQDFSREFLDLVRKYEELGERRRSAGDTDDRRPYVVELDGYPYRLPRS